MTEAGQDAGKTERIRDCIFAIKAEQIKIATRQGDHFRRLEHIEDILPNDLGGHLGSLEQRIAAVKKDVDDLSKTVWKAAGLLSLFIPFSLWAIEKLSNS